MIGDWVDQKGDMKIFTSVKWGENKAYLTRTTTYNAGEPDSFSSLMVLGFDGQSGQIRSWQFDSNGGRGEAVWNRAADDSWILHASGCQANGSPNSMTQVVTIAGKDAFTTRSYDRIIGGEIAPDLDLVTLVRKAPAVGGAPAAPTALRHLNLCNAVLLRTVVIVDEGDAGCLRAGNEVPCQRARGASVFNSLRAAYGVVL